MQTGPSATFDASGRFIAFQNDQPVRGVRQDLLGVPEVFVWDVSHRSAELISTSSTGVAPVYPVTGGSTEPHISANGRFVAFSSNALNLVDGDTNLMRDVFVHDRVTRTTERVSVSSQGAQGNEVSQAPAISASGRFVAFWSVASNLVADDTNGVIDVFVHDRDTGKTERVSVASDGTEARATGQEGGSHGRPSISHTGRFVAFHSWADNLAEGDTNGSTDAFVHDRKTGTTEVVSVNDSGELADFGGNTEWVGPQGISADGRFVMFTSTARNLVPNDANPSVLVINTAVDAFVHDRKTRRTQRVSVSSAGEEATGNSGVSATALSASGRAVIFSSNANDLTSNDTGGSGIPPQPGDHDVFLYDRAVGATEMISVDPEGREPTGCRAGFDCARALGLDRDGATVVFESYASLSSRDETTDEERTMYVRQRGLPLGVDGWEQPDGDTGGDDRLCIVDGICVAGRSSVGFGDPVGDAGPAATERGADLIGTRISYRQASHDLFAVLELAFMPATPTLATATQGLVYGLSFEIEGEPYEIRAASAGVGLLGMTTADFALFSCPRAAISCTKVSDLHGGFGTTGQRITFSLPLEELGVELGSILSKLRGWSAVGTMSVGRGQTLDEAQPAGDDYAEAGEQRLAGVL